MLCYDDPKAQGRLQQKRGWAAEILGLGWLEIWASRLFSVCVFFFKSKKRRWRWQPYKIKIVHCKEKKKSNDFLADKIKCMVNRISNETQKKWRNFYPPISWPFLLRGTLFHICNRQINYHMKRKMFTITMAWLCLWQIILKILPTPHLLPKLKCEKKGKTPKYFKYPEYIIMYLLIGGWRFIMKFFKLKRRGVIRI